MKKRITPAKRWATAFFSGLAAALIVIVFIRWQQSHGPAAPPADIREYLSKNAISCMAPPSYVSEDFLRKPIGLKTDIGHIDFPIDTRSREAQALFNQGMAYFNSFEWVQSARSFYSALAADSSAAMIWYGLSKAYNSLYDTVAARECIATASRLVEKRHNALESAIIRLQQLDLSEAKDSATKEEKRKSIVQQAGVLENTFGDKAETWLFIAGLYSENIQRGLSMEQQDSVRVKYLLKAEELDPRHFGVWHWLIHTYEGLGDFKACLKYGKLYAEAAPAIPHAWHMYAHDLMKTGRMDEAIQKFNYAFSLEEKKYRQEGMPARYDWHHIHNLELLAYCYQHKGQLRKADSIFTKLDTIDPSRKEREGYVRKGHPEFLLQNGRFREAIVLAERLQAGRNIYAQNVADALAGFGYVLSGDTSRARENANRLLSRLDSVKRQRLKEGMAERTILSIQGFPRALQGLVDVAIGLRKDPYNTALQAPILKFQQAMLDERTPDGWISSLYFLQFLTQMTFASGNMELARGSAMAMLRHDPDYAMGYWLLAKTLNRMGRHEEAMVNLGKAKQLYRDADADAIAMLQL